MFVSIIILTQMLILFSDGFTCREDANKILKQSLREKGEKKEKRRKVRQERGEMLWHLTRKTHLTCIYLAT